MTEAERRGFAERTRELVTELEATTREAKRYEFLYDRTEETLAAAQAKIRQLEQVIQGLKEQLQLSESRRDNEHTSRLVVGFLSATAGAIAGSLLGEPLVTVASAIATGGSAGLAEGVATSWYQRLRSVGSKSEAVTRSNIDSIDVHAGGATTVTVGGVPVRIGHPGPAPTVELDPPVPPIVPEQRRAQATGESHSSGEASAPIPRAASATGSVRSSGEATASIPPPPSSGESTYVLPDAAEARAEAQQPQVRTGVDAAPADDGGGASAGVTEGPDEGGDRVNITDSLVVENTSGEDGTAAMTENVAGDARETEGGDAILTKGGDDLVTEYGDRILLEGTPSQGASGEPTLTDDRDAPGSGDGYTGTYGEGTYGGSTATNRSERPGGWQVGSVGFGGDTRGLTEPEDVDPPVLPADDNFPGDDVFPDDDVS